MFLSCPRLPLTRRSPWNTSRLERSALTPDQSHFLYCVLKMKQKRGTTLTGSRRRSSVSRRAVRGFGCTSSLHSLSEAGGDSARSGKSSRVLGPRKRILSRRFSMVNTAHLGFTLTWWTATLRRQRQQDFMGQQQDSRIQTKTAKEFICPLTAPKLNPLIGFMCTAGVVLKR